eukprot:Partr_v1_DN43430_c0_g1_i1_m13606 putative Tocopherol (Alpha) transfer protein-like
MAAANPLPKGDAVVDKVTGAIVETPELRAEGLAQLRAAMKAAIAGGTVERYPREDDRFLLAFLRARKYDVPRAAKLVANFARFWYSHADLIDGLCAEKCRPFLEMKMMKFLPGKDVNGNTVAALYMGALDVARYSPREQAAFSVYALANLFEDDDLQTHGATYVETMEGFTLGSAMALGRKMDSKEQKEMMNLATQTFPLRIRGIYLVHQPWYFSLFWAIVRPFLHSKMVSRLRLFGKDLPALHKLVPAEVLPPEFGGTADVGWDWYLNMLEAKEKATGMLGGFAVPMSV